MKKRAPPHFIINPNNNITSDQLKIPSKFSKHLEGKTCGMVSLMGPSGNTWHADLSQQNDGLYIVDGWAAFVRDNFLENRDSLVFKYNDNLHFTVQIFDQSSCEKDTAFSAECHQDLIICDQHSGKKRERECTSLLTSMVDCVQKKARSVLAHEATNVAEMQSGRQAINLLNGSELCGSVLRNSIIPALPLAEVCPNEDEFDRISAFEADKIAQSYTSRFPHFTKVMKGFNVSGSYTLNVPYQFAMAHLPDCKVKLVLHNLKGESWTINSVPTIKVQTSHTFCGGWLSFVRDNKINVRDVCIFELVGKCELRVNILRVKHESLDHENGDVSGPSTNRNSHKISGRMTKKIKGSDDGSQSISGKSEVCPNEDEFDRISAFEADKIAQSYTSRFPHFTKVMKGFNVSGSYTLNVPYQFAMSHLPDCKVKLVLHNLKGESWTINSVPTTKVQTSHTFCGGWLSFVRDNKINVRDVCIFELVGKCELRVNILRVRHESLDHENGDVSGPSTNRNSHKISGRMTKKIKGSDDSSQSINRKSGKAKGMRVKRGPTMMGCMSMKSEPEERIAAESFISSFPYFVKVMKKFNVSGSSTLKVPYQFSMEHLPSCKTKILLLNLRGQSWTVNSVTTIKQQTLHSFCGGWIAFVRDNGIQMGDICIFELIGRCEMRVHISRFGENIVNFEYQTGNGYSNELAIESC